MLQLTLPFNEKFWNEFCSLKSEDTTRILIMEIKSNLLGLFETVQQTLPRCVYKENDKIG